MENTNTYTKDLVTSLLRRITTLEREIEDMSDLSSARVSYIHELEDIVYLLRCPICKQVMDVVSKMEPYPTGTKGEMVLQEVILTCGHPLKKD